MEKGEKAHGHRDGSTAARRLRIPPVFTDLGAPGRSSGSKSLPQQGRLRQPHRADATWEEQS